VKYTNRLVQRSQNIPTHESNCLRVQFKTGGIIHLRLKTEGKPIANKYRKGQMKRTLKRESKELEAVEMDAFGHDSIYSCSWIN
jgi:hypothetical protein